MTPRWQRFSWILFGLSAAVGARAATFTVTVAPGGMQTFSPSVLTINVGDTVHWVWAGSGHSTTSGNPCTSNGLWDSGVQGTPFSFDFTFAAAGTYNYFCTPHCLAGMTGTIIVNAPPSPTPTFTFTPTPPGPSPTPAGAPTPTPTPLPGAGPAVPAVSPPFLALLAITLAATALLLIRRR